MSMVEPPSRDERRKHSDYRRRSPSPIKERRVIISKQPPEPNRKQQTMEMEEDRKYRKMEKEKHYRRDGTKRKSNEREENEPERKIPKVSSKQSSEKKKLTLDEENFEPDYDLESETEESGKKIEEIVKKPSKSSSDSEASSSSESSSSDSSMERKKKKRKTNIKYITALAAILSGIAHQEYKLIPQGTIVVLCLFLI
uniref:Uncharacterized protein n=1 Tax=Cacopsylla melanoneura TaxID=428564 RepID=A0A8D8U4I1_9HEMI